MNTFNTNMFQSIKAALSKNEEKSAPGLYNEILKTVPGNTYTVRLLPYAKDPSKTFFTTTYTGGHLFRADNMFKLYLRKHLTNATPSLKSALECFVTALRQKKKRCKLFDALKNGLSTCMLLKIQPILRTMEQ